VSDFLTVTVMYAWLYTVTGLCMRGCLLLQGYMCWAVHGCRVSYALQYTVAELCVLGCTLLQGYV